MLILKVSIFPHSFRNRAKSGLCSGFFSALKQLNLENLLQFPAKGFSIRLKRAPPEARQRGNMIEKYFKRGEVLANGRAERK